MALAYDPTTGVVGAGSAPVETSGVPDEVLKSGKVPMLDNVGNPVFVDSKDVDSAVSQGFKYESPEQEVERKKETEYGNSPFLAGTLGAARTLTFGLSDVAGRSLGFADALREIKTRNEASSTAGEVVGAVAPLLFTLGGSAPVTAAQGATSLGRAGTGLLTAGRIAEVTAPALITKGAESLAKKVVAEGWKRVAVQGALEGAGFGAGQAVSDIAMTEGDITPDRVAESLISNVGMGAFMGGALSLGAYGVGKGLGKITDPLKKKLLGTLGQSENAIAPGSIVPDTDYGMLDQYAYKQNADDLIRIIKDEMDVKNVSDIPAELLLKSEKEAASAIELGKRSSLSGGDQFNKQVAFKQKVNEYGKKIFNEITDITDDASGEALVSSFTKKIQDTLEANGKGFEKARESTKFIPLSDKAKAQIVSNIEKFPEYRLNKTIRGQLDEAIDSINSAQNADELKKVATIIYSNMVKPAYRAGQKESGAALKRVFEKVRDFETNSILRSAIEQAPTRAEGLKIGKQLVSELKVARKNRAEFYGLLEDIFGEGGAKLARGKSIDPHAIMDKLEVMNPLDVVNKFTTTKNARALTKLQKQFPEEFAIVKNNLLSRVKRVATDENGVFDPTKVVNQLTDSKFSPEALKILLGKEHDKLINLKKIFQSNPKAYVNWSNTSSTGFNDSIAMSIVFNTVANIKDSILYTKLYKLPAMIQAVNKTETKLNTRIAKFVTNATKQVSSSVRGGAVVIANNMQEKNYEGRLDKLEELAANPDKILDHVVDSTTGVSDDPALQSALQTKGMQAANFLIEKMPKRPEVNNVFGTAPKYKPSDQELSKWNRYVRAVDNPMTILDDLNAGILTPESVEAVRTIYPDIYAQMSQKIIDKMATVKKPISYQAKLQISTLLGIPISSALGPQFIQSMQGNIQPEQQEQKPRKINAGQIGKSKFSDRAQSSTNKLLSR
jgi:hypothetical protein